MASSGGARGPGGIGGIGCRIKCWRTAERHLGFWSRRTTPFIAQRSVHLWLTPLLAHYLGGMTDDTAEFNAQAELEYLRQTPAEDLLANHFFVLAQWAAVHLASSPADLVGAQLVIDVMAALLDAGDERLGSNVPLYRTALSEIQQVFVRASLTSKSPPNSTPPANDESSEA